MSTKIGWRTRLLVVTALAVVAILGMATTAHAVAPTQPLLKDTWVSGAGKVTVQWYASTDPSGHAVSYDIYRDVIPVTDATIVSRSLTPVVTGFSGTTVQINATAAEIAQSYVWFYSVVAKDDQPTPNKSAASLNMAPNLHGYRFDTNLIACTRCHSAHGVYKIPYTEKGSCYTCHGGTGFTAAMGARSTYNTEASFYDTGTITPGSRHRNQYMTDAKQDCTACHTPHRTPYYYNASGVYDAASSFRRMLRVEYATNTYAYYSKNSVPAQANEFCFSCHGGSAVTWDGKTINASSAIGIAGGPTAYSAAGGDHNYSGYAASAHGTGIIYSNNYDGSAATTDNPAVQCEACHHNHASAADKLIDYRSSDTTVATKWAQSGLCYGCHSAASTETSVNTGVTAKPFAWNGRDVKAQFAKVSHHPTVARVGSPVAEPGSTSQTTQADFGLDALTNTTVVSGGSGTSGAVQLTSIFTTGVTVLTEGFELASYTTNFPTAVGEWERQINWSPGGSYSIRGGNGTTAIDTLTSKSLSLAGWANVTVAFQWQSASLDAGQNEFMRVQYSVDGTNWIDGWAREGDGATTPGAYSFTIPSPSATTYVRLRVENADLGEYGYWDDVIVTGDQPNGYLNSGNVVSVAMPVGAGSVSSWTTVNYTVNQPAGSTIAVDVLDASDDTVLLSGVTSGQSLSALTASQLKLRARLTGNAPAARVVSDDFNDNSFDTSKWTDFYMSSTDADAAYSTTLRSLTFATALLDATTGMDSRTPDSDSTGWYRNTNNGSDGTTAGYARTGTGNGGTTPRVMTKSLGDLSGLTSVDISFAWSNNSSTMTTGDYLLVEWRPNASTGWTTLLNRTSTAQAAWTTNSTTGLAVGTASELRVTGYVQDETNDEWCFDTVTITGNYPAGNSWPKEAGTQLTLRAEGTRIGGGTATDEGEFTYVKPTAADWVDTQDWDMVVAVPSYNNIPADGWMRTGLMVRTGSTEANAYASGAIMAGVFVTDTNGVVFQARTAVNGAATADAAGTGDAPVYLKLSRRGTTITGYKSTDGATWVQVGSQTLTLGTYVLPGLCLSSDVNGQFAEATFDDFSVTENTGASTVTPRLDDWSVTYQWIPSPTVGSLTCVNCHNVHYAGTGTAGTVWQMVRAALPSNTKVNYAGTPTQFCLECHDGSAPNAAVTNETTIVPYAVEFSSQSASPFFPGWDKTGSGASYLSSGHYTSAAGEKAYCNNCHDPHASDFDRLTAWTRPAGNATLNAGSRENASTTLSREENLCYQCHGNGTTGKTATGALNVATAFGLTYRHPVEVIGRHSDTETASQLGSANRHAECADCHDPHGVKPGRHTDTNSKAGDALVGAIGIKPATAWPGNWTVMPAGGWATERMTDEATDVEAYVCLKCHSSYSGQPYSVTSGSGTYPSTDLALEFNPSNQSEHNVLGQSVGMETVFTVNGTQYDWAKPADTAFLLSPWTSNSQMTCTACHSNTTAAAQGPHGSSQQWLLQPGYTTWTNTTALTNYSGIICAKCHTNLVNSNIVHSQHDSRGADGGYCRLCHIKIPHGWKRPRLIGYTTDPAPYATISGGIVEIALKDYTDINAESATGWGKEYCYAACSTSRHPDQATAWP